MQKVQGDGLCRPSGWQLVFGGFRHEREHEEGIECRPELLESSTSSGESFHRKNSSQASPKNSSPNSWTAYEKSAGTRTPSADRSFIR
jgi:hypothetical protein